MFYHKQWWQKHDDYNDDGHDDFEWYKSTMNPRYNHCL